MEETVKVNGINVCYELQGRGEVVLFLHGMGFSHDMWGNAVKAASKYYTTCALDLPGFGDSDKPESNYGIPFYVSFIKDFMNATGIDNAAIVGVSMGGAIAAGFAAKNPGRVSRLVLTSPIGLTPLYNGLPGLPLVSSSMYLFMSRSKELFKHFAEGMFYKKDVIPHDILWQEWARMKHPSYRAALVKNAKNLSLVDPVYEASIRSIRAPTLIIWGRNDMIVPLSDAYRYRDQIQSSELAIIEKCGHVPPMEQADEFNRVFMTFVGREERYYEDDRIREQA
ncbi:MAG TPA: alpha/beta hydrolase [Methanocellaceae archaeon]|jgi:pimeloyl-ACP methyl ester carboxylesterase